MTESDPRITLLRLWLQQADPHRLLDPDSLRPASSDASFRRYFRIDAADGSGLSRIIMDAPPPQEDCAPFVAIARRLSRGGVAVPEVLAQDLDQGFLLLSDLGPRTMLTHLGEHPEQADALYRRAIRELILIQQVPHDATADAAALPPYDRDRLDSELRLFDHWYLDVHRQHPLSDADRATISDAYRLLIARALAQPQVSVHRDFHSRNLMTREDGSLGVLDFQDALVGPITYDLVSLLRDAYVVWPEAQSLDWAIRYWEAARNAGLPVATDFGEFFIDFEFMGIQRHLKVLGIFARLWHRDGKQAYLADMPRVMQYLRQALQRYQPLNRFERLLARLEGEAPVVGYTF